jgi:hypothetical protein
MQIGIEQTIAGQLASKRAATTYWPIWQAPWNEKSYNACY